jgi:hypothetical protein
MTTWPFLVSLVLKLDVIMYNLPQFLMPSFIHVSCQLNFVEEGKFRVPLSTTSQTWWSDN